MQFYIFLQHKVSSVTFQSGPNSEELFKLRTVEVESRATGWLSCSILGKQILKVLNLNQNVSG